MSDDVLRVVEGLGFVRPGVMKDTLRQFIPSKGKRPLDAMVVRPQAKQEKLLEACGLRDYFWDVGEVKPAVAGIIGYGGAAYGAKTFGLLLMSAAAMLAWPGVQVVFFRRTYRQIFGPGGVSNDARQVFAGLGNWRDDGREFVCENGSGFYFRHCENETDVYGYDGQQFDILIFDEATHFTWFQIDYLMGRNRVSGPNGIPRPFTVMCSNPGNIGHSWFYGLYELEKMSHWLNLHPGEYDYESTQDVKNENGETVRTHFILSVIGDNPIGLQRDPEYPDRLSKQDPARAKALLNADWESFAGQVFMQFDKERHVIDPFEIPATWPRLRGIDGGHYDPFCCLWGAVQPGTGRLYVYRELYEAGVTDDDQARRILLATPSDENIYASYGDPTMWNERDYKGNVTSTFREYLDEGLFMQKGNYDRVMGKRTVDRMLADGPDGKPLLQIFKNCYNLIDELPKLPRSPSNPEDVDPKAGKDHAYAALRYLGTNIDVYIPKAERDRRDEHRDPRLPGANVNPMQRLKGI